MPKKNDDNAPPTFPPIPKLLIRRIRQKAIISHKAASPLGQEDAAFWRFLLAVVLAVDFFRWLAAFLFLDLSELPFFLADEAILILPPYQKPSDQTLRIA